MIIKLKFFVLTAFFFQKFHNIFVCIKEISFGLFNCPSCSIKPKRDFWRFHYSRINILSNINPPDNNINLFHSDIPDCNIISFNVLI